MKATLSGHHGLATDASLLVANTDEEWSRAMSVCFPAQRSYAEYLTYDVNGNAVRGRSAGREVFDRLPSPLDLADHTAIFLCAGRQGPGVFAVVVKSVAEQADAVEVRYEVAPNDEVRKSLESSSPFTILFIEKTTKPIRFVTGDKAVATVDGGARADVVNGLQLLLEVKPTTWKIGATVEFACLFRKVTDKPWRVMRWGLGSGGAIEVADDVAVAVKPQFMRDATRKLTDADCPFLDVGEKRFTLSGRILKDGTLLVNEPRGGEFIWELAAGSHTVRATLGVKDADWTLPMEQMEMRWTGKVRSNAVKVTLAETGPARVDLADEANGLKLALEVKPANWKPGDKIELVCAATNVSDKPIRVPAWGLDMFPPLEFTDAAGKKRPLPSYGCKHCREYVAEDFPTLAPGETKRFTANASFDAHGGKQYLTVWEGRGGAWGYELPNGAYQVSASAENKDAKERANFPIRGPQPALWTGKAVSAPAKVTVGAAGLVWGEAVNGLQLALEVTPGTWSPGAQIEFACTATNVSDKPIRVAAWGLDLMPALEVTDPKGKVLPNDGGRNGLRQPPADSFPTIPPGERRRFTLSGRVTDKKMLIVNELLGGIWHWNLIDGEHTLRAELWRQATDEDLKRRAGNEGAWTGRAFSAPIKVTVGEAPAPTRVDLAPLPGAPVKGLKLALSADRAFLTMTPRKLRKAAKDDPRYDVDPVTFTLNFTNVSDKPIKLDAFAVDLTRVRFDIAGPDVDSVVRKPREELFKLREPQEKDFPVIDPEKSWSCEGKAKFPCDLGNAFFALQQSGEYRVKATYNAPDLPRATHPSADLFAGIWQGSVTSNELVLAAVVPGEAVNGLKLTISADRTELRMTRRNYARSAPDSPPFDVEPIEVKIAFTNVSDKPIKIGTFNLPTSGVQPDVVGPDAESVKLFRQRMLYNHMRVVAESDYPTLAPGETWTCKETYSFPSSQYEWVTQFRKPGEFRLRLVYARQPVEAAKNAYPFILGAWSGTLMSNELVFKAAEARPDTADGPARVDLEPLPGAPVNGLKLTLAADRTFLAMTARELLRATKDTPRWNVAPAKLKFTFANVSGQPIKLDAYDLAWSRLTVDVKGPDAESVRIVKRMVEREMIAPEAKHYPTIAPGETWEYPGSARFPGDFGENEFLLLEPGWYRVKVTYARAEMVDGAKPPAFAAGAWTGSVTSNELTLIAAEPGAAVNGLKIELAADKNVLNMTPLNLRRATRDQPHYGIEPVQLSVNLTNVSDKPFPVDVYDLVWRRLRLHVVGPVDHSVVEFQREIKRAMLPPTPKDYPVIEPGKSWTLGRPFAFPGEDSPQTIILNAPGEYRLCVRYSQHDVQAGKSPFPAAAAVWSGTVVSNELVLKGVEPGAAEVPALPAEKRAGPTQSWGFSLSDEQVREIALQAVKALNEPVNPLVKAIEPQVSLLVSDSPATGGKIMIPAALTNSAFRCVLLGYGPAAPKRAYACVARDGKAIYPFTVADFPAVLAKEDLSEWSDARYEDAAKLYVHLTTLASQDGWVVLRSPKDFMAITFNMRKDDAGVRQREAAAAEIKPPAVARAKDKVVVTFWAWHNIGGRIVHWTVEFGAKFAANSDELGRFGGGGYD